ncbi:cytochrome P450 [Actinoallomurus rhizosphaericola]|uniref:cytochrome P450 n=1 Tax=Actinoallomurus rhizosphaericola TaxID=2952536 RepID=UPI0020902126|nr:cytochrome P450 [Actinoallomurus rhizosphaericola]MCO5993339.1 cytochrome P450 [Actinoallomurus rhizosphaericola]
MSGPETATDFDVTADWHVADPYPFLARLRRERPVFWSDHLRMWVLTRYTDVRDAYRDHRRFSSVGSLTISRTLTDEVKESLGEHRSFLDNFAANVDPPQHTRIRRAISRAFTPRAVARLGEAFAAQVDAVLDAVEPRGHADFVADLAHPPSARLTAAFIGVPPEDEDQVKQWVYSWFQLFLSPQPPARQRELAQDFLKYLDYVDRLVTERRAEPRDDFAGLMAELIGVPGGLSHREVVETISALLLGGNDTVPNGLGNAVHRMQRDRASWEAVVAGPALIPGLIEETLRIDGASLGSFRRTTGDVTLHGVTIPAGAEVFLHADSAGHDETVFPDPERFDIHRANARDHMVFGYGVHHCVGAALARLELRIALERITARLPGLRLVPDQDIAYRRSLVGRGLPSLLVEW